MKISNGVNKKLFLILILGVFVFLALPETSEGSSCPCLDCTSHPSGGPYCGWVYFSSLMGGDKSCLIGNAYQLNNYYDMCWRGPSCTLAAGGCRECSGGLDTECRTGSCPNVGERHGENCYLRANCGLACEHWGNRWEAGESNLHEINLKWDANAKQCVKCEGRLKTRVYGDTSGIYVGCDDNSIDIPDTCESACGAAVDEVAPNSCSSQCGYDNTKRLDCYNANCEVFDGVCSFICGADDRCNNKNPNEPCGTNGKCDSNCQCIVTPKPDLIITAISFNSNKKIAYTIKNQGTANASTSYTAVYVKDGSVTGCDDQGYKGYDTVSSLGAGASRNEVFDGWTCTSGQTYTVSLYADGWNGSGWNFIDESNEGNNCKYQTLTCPVTCTLEYPTDKWHRAWYEYNSSTKSLTNCLGNSPHETTEKFINDWGGGYVVYEYGKTDLVGFQSGRSIYLTAGTYRFKLGSDDGAKLWIDGSLKIDRWYDTGLTWTEKDVYLTAGWHNFRIDYYENSGGAAVGFSYEKVCDETIVPYAPSINSPDAGSIQRPPSFAISVSGDGIDPAGCGPINCFYHVGSAGYPDYWTVGWGSRPCNGSFNVTVGPDQNCRNEGTDTCAVHVFSQDQAGNTNSTIRSFSISFCTSHASYSCWDNDVYWYDSCGNREEKKQECGATSYSCWSKCRQDYTYTCSGGTCGTYHTYTNASQGYRCEGGNFINTGSCATSSYNGRSTDKCDKKRDLYRCNGTGYNDSDCNFDVGDEWTYVLANKIANSSGSEVDASSADNAGTCHSCTEGSCLGTLKWGECDGSGNPGPCATYNQLETIYPAAGYSLTSTCGTTGTTNCDSNFCWDGGGHHEKCDRRCNTAHSCDYYNCVNHCINTIQDCDETGIDCGGSCPSCDTTPPTTTIKVIRKETGEDVTNKWLRADTYIIKFEDNDPSPGSGLKSGEYYINSCDANGTNCTTSVVPLTNRACNWSFDIIAGETAPTYKLQGWRYLIYSRVTDNANNNSEWKYQYLWFDFTPPRTWIE